MNTISIELLFRRQSTIRFDYSWFYFVLLDQDSVIEQSIILSFQSSETCWQ